MAVCAGEDGVVVRIRVAGGAHAVGIAMVHREECVILRRQCCRKPCSRCVAGRAGSRPPGCDVIWVRRRGEVPLVARVAVCWRTRKHVIDVALGARDIHVRARERERGVVVIECGAGPRCSRVARPTSGREAGRRVIGISRAIPVALMASIAGSWQCRVVVIYMALRALHGCVCAGERK